LISFFSTVDSAFFFAFSLSKYSYMGRKSQNSKFVIFVPSRCKRFLKGVRQDIFQVTYWGILLEYQLPILKEILVESLVLRMIGFNHGRVEASHLLSRRW
jgi:hypothetical protein